MPDLQTSANLPLVQLRAGNNHRKHFDEAKLAELAASVKVHGVLQPVLVRPLAKPAGKVTHEIVAGERRWRAAKEAGLKTLPVVIRKLDDKAALEVGLIENLRRADVLPMEEAEGYRELHEVHKESVDQIAERVGKSKEYVYGRMKLTELRSPAVRKALDEGRVDPSTALLIARIPGEKLQEQAAKKILEGGSWDPETGKPGPMSFRRAKEVVQEEYQLQLSKAPFSTKDANLVPEAGACGPCPKRTGNCKALYPEVKSDNVCTDPECFGKKKAAAFKTEAAEARAEGKKLLKDSKALWDWEGKKLGYKGKEKYVELGDKCPGDKKGRTFKQLLGDKARVVLARDPNGKTHELLEKEGLNEALEAAGHKIKMKEPGQERSGGRDYEKQQKEAAFRSRVMVRLAQVVGSEVGSRSADESALLRVAARRVFERHEYHLSDAWKERRMPEGEDVFFAKGDAQQFLSVLLEVLLFVNLRETWEGYTPETGEVCAAVSVKLEDLEEEQRQADAAAPAKGEKDSAPNDDEQESEDGEGD